jgi:Cys-tRNA(Pro)/Cys-tRNA(Cys) deacylase
MASATPAAQALTRAGKPFTLHEYAHQAHHGAGRDGSAGFGDEAAAALGVDPGRLYKTLIVDAGGRLAVAVVPVAGMLDLKAMAAAIEAKSVRMAESVAAERATGYVVGGISPLGQRKRLTTVIDAGATGWPTVFVSAGRRGLQVELDPADLVALTAATLAPIGRLA